MAATRVMVSQKNVKMFVIQNLMEKSVKKGRTVSRKRKILLI